MHCATAWACKSTSTPITGSPSRSAITSARDRHKLIHKGSTHLFNIRPRHLSSLVTTCVQREINDGDSLDPTLYLKSIGIDLVIGRCRWCRGQYPRQRGAPVRLNSQRPL